MTSLGKHPRETDLEGKAPREKKEKEPEVDVAHDPRRLEKITASNVGRIDGTGFGGRDEYLAALLAFQLDDRIATAEMQRRFRLGHEKEPLGIERIQGIMERRYPETYEAIYSCTDLTRRVEEYPYLAKVGKDGAMHRRPWAFFHSLLDGFLFHIAKKLARRVLELKYKASHPDKEVPNDITAAGGDIYISQCELQCFISGIEGAFLVMTSEVNTRYFYLPFDEAEWRKTKLPCYVSFYKRFLAWYYEDDAKESLSYVRRFLESVNADPARKTKVNIDQFLQQRASDEERAEIKELYKQEEAFRTIEVDYKEIPVKKPSNDAHGFLRPKYFRALCRADKFTRPYEALAHMFGIKEEGEGEKKVFEDHSKTEMKRITEAFATQTGNREEWDSGLEFVHSPDLPFVGEWVSHRLKQSRAPIFLHYMTGEKSRKGPIHGFATISPWYRDQADLAAGLIFPEVYLVLANDDSVKAVRIKRTDELATLSRKRAMSLFHSFFAWYWLGEDKASEANARELLDKDGEVFVSRAEESQQSTIRSKLDLS